MGLNCQCPPAAALTGFVIPQCLESFGQVNKVVFQRIESAAGTKNKITDAKVLANWTPAMTAADGTKAVITPFLSNPEVTPGDKKTYGGGNATPGGVVMVIGSEPTTFTAKMDNIPQTVISAMKKLMCEKVGVYLINERGDIGCISATVGAATNHFPIPVSGLFIGDKALGGLDDPDSNAIEWSFKPDWSDNFVIIKPTDFDALSQLTNTV